MKNNQGFSLIEVLAATVLLGVMVTAVLAPLAQLFENTGDSGQTLRVTTQTQEVVEAVRGQWKVYPITTSNDVNRAARDASLQRYARTCGTLPAAGGGVVTTVTVQGLNRLGAQVSTPAYNAACTGALDYAEIKRVTVTGRAPDGTRTVFTVDVPRPCIDVNNLVNPPVCRDSPNFLPQRLGTTLGANL